MPFREKIHKAKQAILNDPDFGVITDVDVAKKYDIESRVVTRLRNELGIPPANPLQRKKAKMLADPELGKMTDPKFAEKYDVLTEVVYRLRKAHGIPAYKEIRYHPARPPGS